MDRRFLVPHVIGGAHLLATSAERLRPMACPETPQSFGSAVTFLFPFPLQHHHTCIQLYNLDFSFIFLACLVPASVSAFAHAQNLRLDELLFFPSLFSSLSIIYQKGSCPSSRN